MYKVPYDLLELIKLITFLLFISDHETRKYVIKSKNSSTAKEETDYQPTTVAETLPCSPCKINASPTCTLRTIPPRVHEHKLRKKLGKKLIKKMIQNCNCKSSSASTICTVLPSSKESFGSEPTSSKPTNSDPNERDSTGSIDKAKLLDSSKELYYEEKLNAIKLKRMRKYINYDEFELLAKIEKAQKEPIAVTKQVDLKIFDQIIAHLDQIKKNQQYILNILQQHRC